MAEPVSLIAAGVGIADVAVRIIAYLKDVKAAVETIEDDIEGLINEVHSLKVIHGQLEQEFLKNVKKDALAQEENILWFNTGHTLKQIQKLTLKLEVSVRHIYGENPRVDGKRDGLLKQHRKRTKDGIISGLRDQVSGYQNTLQCWLTCISMYSNREQYDSQKTQLEQLRALVQDVKGNLERNEDTTLPAHETATASAVYNNFTSISLSVLSHMGRSINDIGNGFNHNTTITNEHFYTPKPVDSFYTGREEEAEKLKAWLLPTRVEKAGTVSEKAQVKQKRFVIYGIGGSGKTQFCCKFAEDNRDYYWGVFWVDGSSHQRLKQTFSQNVSVIGGVEANEKAAINWLSNLRNPWLLIIDNADDRDFKLDEYFPRGNRGHVLITTRDYATGGLNGDDASCLLLAAAGQARPWDSTIFDKGKEIADALGYLALAISQAGITIRKGYCKLQEYLGFHKRQWTKTGQKRQSEVLATFEVNREAIEAEKDEASRDALQLLDTFAFLHNQDIRFHFLRRAITNAEIESTFEKKEKEKELQKRAAGPPPDWATWLKETRFAILDFIYRNRTPPVLPSVIRAGREFKEFDPDRLRAALRPLTKYSLIVHNERTDSYSIHPLVHKWARERPEMSLAEEGLWCGAAATLLTCCILRPPLGNTTEDEDLRKYLLPHVDHVRLCQKSIDKRMEDKRERDKRMARMKLWPVFDDGFNREKAIMYAKFSIVYSQNGLWKEAKRLQQAVKDFTFRVLGLEHVMTRAITLALAGTLFNLGKSDDAAVLQEQVLKACIDHLGPEHHETLVAKCTLGDSRYLQGRFSDAKALQEEAGLKKLHGLLDEDTLHAIDYLGRTVLMFYSEDDIKRARELHLTAVEGMRKVHGRDHLRTLIACENLCTTAVRSGDQAQLHEAHEMMIEVFETRRKKLGREHGYTLLAQVNLANIKAALGKLEEADNLIQLSLPIAERNLGPDHHACLWGRCQLGKIWVQQKRWVEAVGLLVDVTGRQHSLLQGRGRYHPDRLSGLADLAAAYNALGKFEECDKVVSEVLDGFNRITTSEHPFARKVKEDWEKWVEERGNKSGDSSLS